MEYPLYCINLSSRQDRWQSMQHKFNGMNLIRFPAVAHKNGWKGLIFSNFFLLQEQLLEKENKTIIVLEDDCLLLDSLSCFKERLPKYLKYLDAHKGEWDFFSGGGIYIKPVKIICKDPIIVECSWSVCTQFIIHSEKSANEVIRWAQEPTQWNSSLDTHMAKKFKKIWLPYPMFCIQENNDDSDISKKKEYKMKINNGFQEAVKILDKFVKENTNYSEQS
jgi:GR25 family glycosyltransferase involved in LPS biosynthesis